MKEVLTPSSKELEDIIDTILCNAVETANILLMIINVYSTNHL